MLLSVDDNIPRLSQFGLSCTISAYDELKAILSFFLFVNVTLYRCFFFYGSRPIWKHSTCVKIRFDAINVETVQMISSKRYTDDMCESTKQSNRWNRFWPEFFDFQRSGHSAPFSNWIVSLFFSPSFQCLHRLRHRPLNSITGWLSAFTDRAGCEICHA